jgi:hypothetical protein
MLLAQSAKCRGSGGWPPVIQAASAATIFRLHPGGDRWGPHSFLPFMSCNVLVVSGLAPRYDGAAKNRR